MIAQPVKLGGFGLRSFVETCPAAFIGGLEMALPHMVGSDEEEGICPQLENIVGHIQGDKRWSDFLWSGSKTSTEFNWAWGTLTSEAKNIWPLLDKEPDGALQYRMGSQNIGGIVQNASRDPKVGSIAVPDV